MGVSKLIELVPAMRPRSDGVESTAFRTFRTFGCYSLREILQGIPLHTQDNRLSSIDYRAPCDPHRSILAQSLKAQVLGPCDLSAPFSVYCSLEVWGADNLR